MWGTATARWYWLGYNTRLYDQARIGVNRTSFQAFHHYDVRQGDEAILGDHPKSGQWERSGQRVFS